MRNNWKWFAGTALCAAIFMAGMLPARAQTASPPAATPAAALPTVNQILDKYVSALGGREAILKISSRVSKGTFELDQMSGPGTIVRYEKAPDEIYSDTELPTLGSYKRGYDGTTGWQDSPQTGLADLTGSALEDMKLGANFYGNTNLHGLFPKMTVKGKETVDGHDAYVIEAVPKDGRPETWYFDAQTGLKIRNVMQSEGPNGPVEVDTTLGDYREVDGVKMPFKIHQSMGMIAFTIQFTDVKQNVPIDDAIFKKPAAE